MAAQTPKVSENLKGLRSNARMGSGDFSTHQLFLVAAPVGQAFQRPNGLWGLFYYLPLVLRQVPNPGPYAPAVVFQRPNGLWGLFYSAIDSAKAKVKASGSFSARMGSGDFSTLESAEESATLLAQLVSAPEWALGTFLLRKRRGSTPRGRVSAPEWALGTFLPDGMSVGTRAGL